MEHASLGDRDPAAVVGLLQHSTDSSADLYRVLQGFASPTPARVELLELNLSCFGEDDGVTLETFRVTLGPDARTVFVLEVGEDRGDVAVFTRYAFETEGELEGAFYKQVERLKRIYPDDDFDELLEAYAQDAAGLEDDAPLD